MSDATKIYMKYKSTLYALAMCTSVLLVKLEFSLQYDLNLKRVHPIYLDFCDTCFLIYKWMIFEQKYQLNLFEKQ
jgi:hypothetical protein